MMEFLGQIEREQGLADGQLTDCTQRTRRITTIRRDAGVSLLLAGWPQETVAAVFRASVVSVREWLTRGQPRWFDDAPPAPTREDQRIRMALLRQEHAARVAVYEQWCRVVSVTRPPLVGDEYRAVLSYLRWVVLDLAPEAPTLVCTRGALTLHGRARLVNILASYLDELPEAEQRLRSGTSHGA